MYSFVWKGIFQFFISFYSHREESTTAALSQTVDDDSLDTAKPDLHETILSTSDAFQAQKMQVYLKDEVVSSSRGSKDIADTIKENFKQEIRQQERKALNCRNVNGESRACKYSDSSSSTLSTDTNQTSTFWTPTPLHRDNVTPIPYTTQSTNTPPAPTPKPPLHDTHAHHTILQAELTAWLNEELQLRGRLAAVMRRVAEGRRHIAMDMQGVECLQWLAQQAVAYARKDVHLKAERASHVLAAERLAEERCRVRQRRLSLLQ